VRTVGKGIEIPPVGRVEDVGKTLRTGRHVGHDQCRGFSLERALPDCEDRVSPRIEEYRLETLNKRESGLFPFHAEEKLFNGLLRTFNVDEDAEGRIPHAAMKTEPGCEAVNEWSEPDALNDAADNDMNARGHQRKIRRMKE
jgi:hypothetical protein